MKSSSEGTGIFLTTRWTQVVATRGETPEARLAFSDLCAAYYAPVVAFLHREGRDEDTARDLAHDFFARMLEHPSFDGADPLQGRFRSYLLGALKHFLANRRLHDQRDKRGGGIQPMACDTDITQGVADDSQPLPDVVFDREWAVSLINRALTTLRDEAEHAGTLRDFDTLKPWLTGDMTGCPQATVAAQLGINEGALRVAIHRLRRRFREAIKSEIAQTVRDPADVADELRHFIEVLSG